MSHSRILIIEEDIDVDVDNVFEEMQSYGNGVDYVTESEDLNEDIQWFHDYLKAEDIGLAPTERGFKVINRDKFYEVMREKVMEELNKPLDDYLWRFRAVDALDMKHGFWFYTDCLLTLPYLMESVENGQEFVIHASLDYHF